MKFAGKVWKLLVGIKDGLVLILMLLFFGGLYAVLATASDSGADSTFVLVVQVLRMFVMVLSAPLIARWLRRARPEA